MPPTLASPSILQSLYWSDLDKLNMTQAARDDAKAHIAGVATVQDRFDAASSTINQARELEAAQDLRAMLAASVAAARRHMTIGRTNDPLLVTNVGAYANTEE